jgi:hypothetical protein
MVKELEFYDYGLVAARVKGLFVKEFFEEYEEVVETYWDSISTREMAVAKEKIYICNMVRPLAVTLYNESCRSLTGKTRDYYKNKDCNELNFHKEDLPF